MALLELWRRRAATIVWCLPKRMTTRRLQGVPHGKKSLAIEVTLQPREKTLTDAEIEAVTAKIVAAVTKTTGGELRG